jgi:hypothetical protein
MDEAGFDTTYFKGTEGDDRQYYSYDGKIYADNEINYFGIGMYDSWAGKPDWASDSQTSFWKKWQYNQSPNENTYYWLQQGRSNYGPPDIQIFQQFQKVDDATSWKESVCLKYHEEFGWRVLVL